MKHLPRIFVCLVLLSWQGSFCSLVACSNFFSNWQSYYPTDIKAYFSPSPRYNIMTPDRAQSLQRVIEDRFMLEDRGNYNQGAGYKGERTDLSLEEYFNQRLGKGDLKFKTYKGNRADIPDSGATMGNLRDLRIDDASPAGSIKTYFHLKMTGGLIFKTDQIQCGTAFEHPKTLHEHSIENHQGDHDHYINADGELEYVSSNTYCYFLYIPKSGNIGPYISRVHANDADSQFYIYEGLAPYLRLKSEVLNTKVASTAAGDFQFFEGRYLLPAEGAEFLIPQNGLNILFNRVAIYRPYHHDRRAITTGSQMEWKVYNQLGAGMPPIKPKGQFWDEPVATGFQINAVGVNMTGLLVDEYMAEYNQDASEGSKSAFGEPVGIPYMALDPEEVSPPEAARIWPISMHFPSATSEKQFFEKALNAGFDSSNPEINHNRIGEANALSRVELNDRLKRPSPGKIGDERRLFQLHMKTHYLTEVDDTNVGIGAGSIEMPCAEVVGKIKEYCDQFTPLMNELEAFFNNDIRKTKPSPPYNDYDWTNDNGAASDVKKLLAENPSVVTIKVSDTDYNIQQKLPAVVDALLTPLNEQFVSQSMEVGGVDNSAFNKFQFQSDVGRKIQAMRRKLELGMKEDDSRYSDAYFRGDLVGQSEDKYFTDFITGALSSAAGKPETEVLLLLQAEFPKLLKRYIDLETNEYLSGSFKYYTAKEASGRRLLNRLYLITGENALGIAVSSEIEIDWKYFGTQSDPQIAGKCTQQDVLLLKDPAAINECLNLLRSPSIPEAQTAVASPDGNGGILQRY